MLERVARILKRYVLWWYAVTVFLYFAMIPLAILVFPATTLLLTIIVLFGGFTSSVASLASVVTDAEQDDDIKDLADDGKLNDELGGLRREARAGVRGVRPARRGRGGARELPALDREVGTPRPRADDPARLEVP